MASRSASRAQSQAAGDERALRRSPVFVDDLEVHDRRVEVHGDVRLLKNQTLKLQVADYYTQIGLQIDQWSAWGNVGITETYFRELAFVVDPELRLRTGTFDPALMRRFLSASCSTA